MKKFQFKLSHMRELKSRILDEEQGVLQQLKSEQAQLENRINTLHQEFGELSNQMLQAQQKGTTALEIRGYSMQLDSIRMQLEELSNELQKAAARVEKQTQVVIAANQEVSKLDKLEDKQYEAYRRQADKAEEQRIEELVVQGISRKDAD